jgi:hypothetical protein
MKTLVIPLTLLVNKMKKIKRESVEKEIPIKNSYSQLFPFMRFGYPD